jgi:putative DNA methylase
MQGGRLVPSERKVNAALEKLDAQGFRPPEGLIAAADNQHFQAPMYGMKRFGDLFTPRQQTLLLTLCSLVRRANDLMREEGMQVERARAVSTYLGLLVDRMSDRHSSLVTRDVSKEGLSSTYSRQALPMTWDYAEANPFGGSGGDIETHIRHICKVIEHCAMTGAPSRVVRASAAQLPLADGQFDAVITDPAYYDYVSYSDLSDYFYVWLQQSIGNLHPEHLSAPLSPKRTEAIVAKYRHGGDAGAARAAYERMIAEAFGEARRVLRRNGILVCVYAHQTRAGWATLIEAVRKAGFVVVEAWPLDTEMPTRGNALDSASLASSIFLVARPREEVSTGDWANDVRPELREIVTERVAELPELGVTGADLIIAAVGAGMRAYTKYERVEKPNGDALDPNEYLEEVEREVSEAVLARIFKTNRGGLGRVDQRTQFYVMSRFEFGDTTAPWDELNTLARGTGVVLVALTRAPRPLVAFGKKRTEARLLDYVYRGEDDGLGVDGSRSTIDHLHRVLWLAENRPQGVKDYLAIAQPDAGRLRLVAQALARPGLQTNTRTREQDACERLLPAWKRLVEDNLFGGEHQ